ncbi:MAG: Uma2 family endonuclease [Alphaproteobacteria bacterium]|nr:Uma2 family endonuclease [Alphaproteobacteria bacterium]
MSEALQATEGAPLLSEDAFLALPESVTKTELVHGELIVSPAPHWRHQRISGRLFRQLAAWCDENPPAEAGYAPLDLRLASDRIVQPDLALWLDGVDPDATVIDVRPDLVVEVISTNRAHDRVTKRLLYADAGIPEYWILDPQLRRVERLTGPGYQQVEVLTGSLASEMLPGLSLDLVALFAD